MKGIGKKRTNADQSHLHAKPEDIREQTMPDGGKPRYIPKRTEN